MNPTPRASEKAIRRGVFLCVAVLLAIVACTIAANLLASSILGREAASVSSAQRGEAMRSLSWLLRGMTLALPLAALAGGVFAFRPLFYHLESLRDELQEAARTDPLTGCLNRRAFAEEAGRLFAHSRRNGSGLAVLMVNADRFRQINDRYGHQAGDVMIRGIAAVLLRNVREMDIAGRMHGEEFAVVLPESGLVAALLVAQRVRRAVAGGRIQARGVKSAPLSITVSIGVAMLQDGDATLYETLDRASIALRKAKQKGRDRVESEGDFLALHSVPMERRDQAGSPSGAAGGRGLPSSGAGSKGIGVKG